MGVRAFTVAVATVLAAAMGQASSATAGVSQPTIVSENPADNTPNVVGGAVDKYLQVGNTMYAGGAIGTVKQVAPGAATYARHNLMAFDVNTGAVTSFAPDANGVVWGLASSGNALYIGGSFTTVDGLARRGLVKYDLATNRVDPSFNANLSGTAYDIQIVNGRLLVGGTFKKRLVALDLTTGKDTGYLSLAISGTVASNAGSTRVYRFAVNPAATRLVAIGNFTSVSGVGRRQAFMIDLSTGALSPWYYSGLDQRCAASSIPVYLRDVDFSPDGSYFVFAGTGYVPLSGDIGYSICDAAARFEASNESSDARPSWINYTGGDTLHSVTVTGATVYVGGHNRYLDNPQGRDSAGPGSVSRPGIGSIDPVSGKATSWNPTRSRGVGAKELYATSTGLWVGSDGERLGGEYHEDIGYLPLP